MLESIKPKSCSGLTLINCPQSEVITFKNFRELHSVSEIKLHLYHVAKAEMEHLQRKEILSWLKSRFVGFFFFVVIFLFVCLFLSACFFSGKSKVFPESSPRCHAGFARKKPSSAVILPLSELRVGLHFSLTASMCATVFRQTQTESYNSLFFSLSLHYNCI